MPAYIQSAAVRGIEALPVDIEVEVLPGLPSFTLVGLGDKTIQESKERLTAALSNTGYTPPRRKTIVSLAPASLKKEGSLYDLPITVGFLCASEQVKIKQEKFKDAWFIGEIGLDGTIRPVAGVLPIALAAQRKPIKRLYVPQGNAQEVTCIADSLEIYPVASLQDLLLHLSGEGTDPLTQLKNNEQQFTWEPPEVDFSDIRGHEQAKRALAIAAAGHHNVLLVGPPGTGKTLLARALAGILPPLSREESYTVTSLYSVAGLLRPDQGLIKARPFRSPHHGASSVALVGGGTNPKPGEVSLAHAGVLFLDELPEFSRNVLDQLRQPIEDGWVTIARSAHTVRYPARSILIGAMNPCKCGYLGSSRKQCQCSPGDVLRYQRKVSGPLLDRFDIHLMITDVALDELLADEPSGTSSQVLAAVAEKTWQQQIARQGKANAALKVKEIRSYCVIDDLCKKILHQAEERFHLSSRGTHRLLKVARTIADMEGSEVIKTTHLGEALQYREQLKAALPDFA